ncbi:MAG: rhodanese-like domain-containing protein [Acidimicrobiia bacterium]|nr:rhodanese-like domain-containing protein [Acidimicrobiia bacterium]
MKLIPRLVLTFALLASACGSTAEADQSSDILTSDGGVRTVQPEVGAGLQADPPSDLVILDVRTPEEFSEVHLEGATLMNFYDADFSDQLATLDPDVPYLVYCRSGNRSGQTVAMMEDLGFTDAANVDGGIVAWLDSDLPVIRP